MTPKQIIDNGRMHWRQWVVVAIVIGLNAIDGFDVLSSAFAGPGIKQEWQLGPDGLGAVLAMELVGMGVGSLILGGAADRYGRRPTILACLLLMATGMFLAALAASPQSLSLWRFITGIGIGGMLSAINAVASEFSSGKGRSVTMALMVIGYPIGGFLGGLIVKSLLPVDDWRAIFAFGAWATVAFIPLVLLFVPESVSFLNLRRPAGALARINRTLASFCLPTLDALRDLEPHQAKASVADIFKAPYLRATILLSFGYSFHAMTFYYVLKMAPVIISDPQFAGQTFSKAAGQGALAYANLGGAIGGAAFGWFIHHFGIKRSSVVALGLSVLALLYFGMGQTTLNGWTITVIAVQLFTNAAIVGFYSTWAAAYPTHIRATGTGFALSIGRVGAALSPVVAGMLFANNLGLFWVSAIMGMGSLIAMLMFAMLDLKEAEA